MKKFITAIGTPLTNDDLLHTDGLAAQLEDQSQAGIDGVLVGGTMGLTPLLMDSTWLELVEQSLQLGAGRFEMLIGVGDTSFARTLGKLECVNGMQGVDSVVVLTPYFIQFSQDELVDYFTMLANASRFPLYLYDLPVLTGSPLTTELVVRLSQIPNIAGMKCSGDYAQTRKWMELVDGEFRFVVAQPDLVDVVLRDGVRHQLDGIFAVAPHWVKAVGAAAANGCWEEAAKWQEQLTALRQQMLGVGIWGSFTAVMNARGIPGRFAPRPAGLLAPDVCEQLLGTEPIASLILESRAIEKSAFNVVA